MKPKSVKVLLCVVLCAAMLPVFLLRDFTPSNELRYLSIADEALANHRFFAFTNHGVPYADKPPLYLWAVMLCRWVAGAHRMWLLSLLSFLPALGVAHTLDRWVAREADGKVRALAYEMLLTCGLFVGSAATLRMDMLMCFFIILALREFWKMWKDEVGSRQARWLFPLYLFLAVFTKGPLGLLIPLAGTAVFLALSRSLKRFACFWGWRTWSVLLVGCLLWFGAVYAEGGADYLNNLVVHQTVGRAVNSFHHDEPFYYYAVSIWYSFAPWSLLIIGVVAVALCRKAVESELTRFFLAVVITTFVLLSCISGKLQIYFLPAMPLLVYAAALLLPRYRDNVWSRVALTVPAVVFALAFPALLVAAPKAGVPYLTEGVVYAAAAVLSVSGVAALYLLFGKVQTAEGQRRRTIGLPVYCIGFGMLLAVAVGGWAMPAINVDTGFGVLCDKALVVAEEQGVTDFRTWRISRSDNMDVYLHRPVQVIASDDNPWDDAETPFLLLTRMDRLQKSGLLEQHPSVEMQTVGRYAIVTVRPEESGDNVSEESNEDVSAESNE